MMKHLILISILFLANCKVPQVPVRSLSYYKFVIEPQIVKKSDSYYIQYQLDSINKNGSPTLLTFSSFKISNGKLYVFFSAYTSFHFTNKIQEMKLDGDLLKYVTNDAVYWLNDDKSSVKLRIVKDQ